MKVLHALFHYAILVGLPFIGVLEVMRYGSTLKPPPSIRGKWVLEAELHSNQKTMCADRLANFKEPVMTISQSGVFLEVHLPNPRQDVLVGRLDGAGLVAEAAPALFGDDVFGLLRVTGTVERERGERVIRGLIAMPRRVDCVPVAYVAKLPAPVPRVDEK